MRMIPKLTSAVLATAFSAVAFTATSLTAQGRTPPPPRPNRAAVQPPNRDAQPPRAEQRGRAPRRNAMRNGQRDGMGRGPAANILRLRERLNLTDVQVEQLQGLSAKGASNTNRADMMRARADLLESRKGDINIEKARTAYDRMARLRTDQRLAQLKVRQEVRQVLTADQRSRVEAMANRARKRR